MKRVTFVIAVSAFCLILSEFARSEVTHPENTSIVGLVFFDTVCFNNDGGVGDVSECDGETKDEGSVTVFGADNTWGGVPPSGINHCGIDAINPVSGAICTYIEGYLADCNVNGYILVQTTQSLKFWAIKADATCDDIASPETTGLVPCLTTDTFDPVLGCFSSNPPEFSVKDGFIQLDSGKVPSDVHCAEDSHHGRMVVDSVNALIYICTLSGWVAK